MDSTAREVYTPREIALAAGVAEEQVLRLLGSTTRNRRRYIPHDQAVSLGTALAGIAVGGTGIQADEPLFAIFADRLSVGRPGGIPLALSSGIHALLLVIAIFATTVGLAPTATARTPDRPADLMRLVFLSTPGPGGGGGGGGILQKPPPPKALREGRQVVSSPVPRRQDPKPVAEAPKPPEPKPPPLNAEPLPAVVAPIVAVPANARNRPGVLEQTDAQADSRGPGRGGGAGTGSGTGLGAGDGAGIGPGSGGGTGGGPYRPGSGIDPPKLLREVKADYTEEARRRNLEGDVVLEIVVRADGGVGDVKLLRGLDPGLDDRAVQAVRQWRFAPARRAGAPVDVIVEVSVEFKLR
jgi:protein TonB